MDRYKKLIPKRARFFILGLFRWLPDGIMLKIQYRIKTGRKLNLKQPERYSEKVQWYKLNYRSDLMTLCADKYAVREYLRSIGEESLCVKLYAVWENTKDVSIENLPEKFIIKTTNGSSTNIICRDKSQLEKKKLNEQLDEFLQRSAVRAGREWAYYGIKPKIIAEELLIDFNDPDGGITDYKFFCFHGKVYYIAVDTDRFTDHKRNIFDREWRDTGVRCAYPVNPSLTERPAALTEMIMKAEKISAGFPAVRVDLYFVNGKIYFGEMTFYPFSGYVKFNPDKFDFVLGEKFILPERKK